MVKKNLDPFILEQYKIAVDMADKISSRRHGTNNFFMTASSIIVTFISTRLYISNITILLSIVGIIISFSWYEIICHYKKLNSAKFKIINKIEENLPIMLYSDERDILKKDKSYKNLTNFELEIPKIFGIFYILLFFYGVYSVYGNKLFKYALTFFN